MFPNWQDIYSQVEAKHTVPIVEDLRNNVVNSTVFYKNRANSNLLQLRLSKLISFISFIRHKQHFCTWNVLESAQSITKSPISSKIQGWAALSMGQYPVSIFHLDTITFWFPRNNTFPKLFATGSLVQALSRFSQKLHFASPYRFFKTENRLRRMASRWHSSYPGVAVSLKLNP